MNQGSSMWQFSAAFRLAAGLLAAAAAAPVDAQPVITDSAGIRVLTYAGNRINAPRWQLEPEPLVTIGAAFGDEPYQFNRIRGAFAHRGGFLVGDGGSGELRFFDRAGRHVKTVGGIGSGPGEFRASIGGAMQWMGRIRGDTLLAWDLPQGRVSIFDPDGAFVRVELLRPSVAVHVVAGAFNDGDLLLWPFGVRTAPVRSAGVIVDTSYFAVVEQRNDAAIDTIVRVPARPVYVEPEGIAERVPFTAEVSYAVGRDVVWAGTGQSGQIARYRKDGAVTLLVRMPLGGEIPDRAVRAFRSAYLEELTGNELAERTRLLSALPMPDELPAFDGLQVDTDGNLWIREYVMPDAAEQTWLVLNDAGRLIGSLATPSAFRVTTIQNSMLVGVWRDELDVETVRAYGYVRRVPRLQ